MSRLKGRLALRDIEFEPKAMNYLLAELLIFDLWAVLKVRQILNVLKKMLPPVLEATCLMSLGAGVAFDVLKCNEIVKSKENSILRLADRTSSFESFLKRELFDLKNRTLDLDIALQKMNAQLKNLDLREKLKDEKMADLASEASGGFVVATPDTESFYEPTDQIALFGIPLLKPSYFTPRKVIQPWTQAGECWAFRGSHGKIEIELPYAATITHVTMEHIPVSLSITGEIDSAPKEFVVFGKFRKKYITIGAFVYDLNGSASQTFPAKREELRQVSFKRVLLEVQSNWGNVEYTCIYRFKVHGKISEDLSKRSSSNKKN